MNIDDYVGKLTAEQSVAVFARLLDLIPEAEALAMIRDWIKERGLEGELE
jgi:hypothetical protein